MAEGGGIDDSGTSLPQTLRSLEQCVEETKYCEALQRYKSLAAAARQKPDAVQILSRGSCELLRHGQWEGGAELGRLLVEHLAAAPRVPLEEGLDTVRHVSDAFTSAPNSAGPDMRSQHARFLCAALRWAQGGGVLGDPGLHQRLACVYEEAGDHGRALLHYARGDSAEQMVHAMAKWASAGMSAVEGELLGARGVLLCLCLKRRDFAESVLQCCINTGGLFDSESVVGGLLRLLVAACARGRPALWEMLTREYAPTLGRDPALPECMAVVGAQHFFVFPPRGPGAAREQLEALFL